MIKMCLTNEYDYQNERGIMMFNLVHIYTVGPPTCTQTLPKLA